MNLAPSSALRASSPPLGEREGVRGIGSALGSGAEAHTLQTLARESWRQQGSRSVMECVRCRAAFRSSPSRSTEAKPENDGRSMKDVSSPFVAWVAFCSDCLQAKAAEDGRSPRREAWAGGPPGFGVRQSSLHLTRIFHQSGFRVCALRRQPQVMSMRRYRPMPMLSAPGGPSWFRSK
jgi:hypothetical protein